MCWPTFWFLHSDYLAYSNYLTVVKLMMLRPTGFRWQVPAGSAAG